MASHNILGAQGETAACRYLAQKGYTLLDRNWRYEHLELDIVAEFYGEIVFVEVKTRSDEHFAPALSSIDDAKMENIRKAAGAYLRQNGLDQPARIDAIVVIGSKPPFEIRHHKGTTGIL